MTRRWLAAVSLVAGTQLASAHAVLLESTPRSGEAVAASPAELRLKFNEPLEPSFSTVRLIGPDGKEVAIGAVKVLEADAAAVSITLPTLAAGAYTARWSAMGRDGHRTKGDIAFRVR